MSGYKNPCEYSRNSVYITLLFVDLKSLKSDEFCTKLCSAIVLSFIELYLCVPYYTKLAMLSFLYCFVVEGKLIQQKVCLPWELNLLDLSIFSPMPIQPC